MHAAVIAVLPKQQDNTSGGFYGTMVMAQAARFGDELLKVTSMELE